MSTDAPVISTEVKSAALVEYAQFATANAETFDALKAAEAAWTVAKANADAKMDELRALVATIGSDPMNLLPAEAKVAGKRGPRDPSKRKAVLVAMQDATISDIVKAVGRDDVDNAYVTGVINGIRTADKDRKKGDKLISQDGERGSYRYTYLGTVEDDDTPEVPAAA